MEIKWDPVLTDPESVHNRTLEALEWYNEETGLSHTIESKLGPPLWTWSVLLSFTSSRQKTLT